MVVTWAVRPMLGSLVRTSLEGFPELFAPKLGHLVRMSLEGLMSFVTEKGADRVGASARFSEVTARGT